MSGFAFHIVIHSCNDAGASVWKPSVQRS